MNRPILIDVSQVVARLEAAPRVIITTHTRADGDAIGSAAGLARLLAARGASVAVMLHEPPPERYAFLTATQPWEVWEESGIVARLKACDLLVIVDTCATMQLGMLPVALAETHVATVAVDHHVTRDPIVDAAWIDERAAACAQMIAELCDAAGWAMPPDVATLLFSGLAADTGWYRFSNAGASVFETAARLVARGARPNELYERLYLNEPLARARLLGEVYSSFELLAGGRLAVIRVTQAMLQRSGATRAMTEDLINEPQRVSSVVACVLAVEPAPGEPVRVSLRSKRDVNVAQIAARFGGGGHERAAGVRMEGPFEEVVEQVTNAVCRALEAKAAAGGGA